MLFVSLFQRFPFSVFISQGYFFSVFYFPVVFSVLSFIFPWHFIYRLYIPAICHFLQFSAVFPLTYSFFFFSTGEKERRSVCVGGWVRVRVCVCACYLVMEASPLNCYRAITVTIPRAMSSAYPRAFNPFLLPPSLSCINIPHSLLWFLPQHVPFGGGRWKGKPKCAFSPSSSFPWRL